jgi:hypothetical protein
MSLHNLPYEIIECIVVLLDLKDICMLRLTSKYMAFSVVQNRYRSFFKAKSVDLTPSALKAFSEATELGQLGCLVQDLTLIGIASSPEFRQDLEETKTILSLLVQAFKNITLSNNTSVSLSLKVSVIDYETKERRAPICYFRNLKFVWAVAAQTFHITIQALAKTSLLLHGFNVFNDKRLDLCSLACDELGKVDFKDEGLRKSFSELKTLSLSLSDKVLDIPSSLNNHAPTDEERWDALASAIAASNFVGLSDFLSLFSSLQTFDLHYFQLQSAGYRISHREDRPHAALLRQVVSSGSLPKLSQCTLRGVIASSEDLLLFIKSTAPQYLSLNHVKVINGSFRLIFEYCTSSMASIENISLIDLYDSRRLQFWPIGNSRPDYPWNGPVVLYRSGSEVKQQIDYHYWRGRTRGSGIIARKNRRDYTDFGPAWELSLWSKPVTYDELVRTVQSWRRGGRSTNHTLMDEDTLYCD